MGTIIVGAILLAVVVCIVGKMAWDKRNGKGGCGCGCSGCPGAGDCHGRRG